jgi:hypothetical protein
LTGKLYAGKSYDELPSREELRTLPSIGQRNGSAEGGKVKKKPLWLRLQEKQQLMDAQAERKRVRIVFPSPPPRASTVLTFHPHPPSWPCRMKTISATN